MSVDPAHLLLRKARDDERLALLVLAEATISDEQIGFLAQQAVEKALKAALSFHGVPYRRTHDLAELIDLLSTAGIAHPEALEDAVVLTPFAAEMRYDYLPPEDEREAPFDRGAAMRLVSSVLAWAEAVVSERGPEDTSGR